MKAWYDADGSGFWLYGRNESGNIYLRRRSARSIGFADGLYSIMREAVWQEPRQNIDQIETGFLSPIDNAASKVHRKLISGGLKSLSPEDKQVWVMFILGLIVRNEAYMKRILDGEGIKKAFHWPDGSPMLQSTLDKFNVEAVMLT
jgi:hypothetical protein